MMPQRREPTRQMTTARSSSPCCPTTFRTPSRRTPCSGFKTNVDRFAHFTANGFSSEQPLPTVELICQCGWRSEPIATPPGTRYVTHTQPDAGFLWAILPEAFWRTCEEMLHAHATSFELHPLRANYMNFPASEAHRPPRGRRRSGDGG